VDNDLRVLQLWTIYSSFAPSELEGHFLIVTGRGFRPDGTDDKPLNKKAPETSNGLLRIIREYVR
jgi:hypothetical protein